MPIVPFSTEGTPQRSLQLLIPEQQKEQTQPTLTPEQKQQEQKPITEPLKVVTWEGSGRGSGTSRTVFLDGRQWATIQIPNNWQGTDEEYVKSQIPKGYKTPSEVTSEQQRISAQLAQQKEEFRLAGEEAHRQQQESLKGSFMGREAQARVYGGQVQEPVVGVEAAKVSESQFAKDLAEQAMAPPVGVEALKTSEIQNAQAIQTIGKIEQREGTKFQNLSQEQLQNLSKTESDKLIKAGFLKESRVEEPITEKQETQLGDITRFSGVDTTRLTTITPKAEEISPIGRTDVSGMPIIPSIIQPAEPQEVKISGEILQKMSGLKTQEEATKWWESRSKSEKAAALVAAGTIDISVAGKYFGSKANESKFINKQIKDIAFGSEKGKQYIADVYKTLNIEGSKTQTPTQRLEEGLTKVGTGTSAQTLAMMVGFGAGTKIITGGLKGIGVGEAAVAGAEKLVGTGFKVAIAGELGSKVAQGKGGEAIAEAGLIATTMPFAAVGERIVSGVGKFTPTVEDFTKFTGEKVITPIRGTETFKFTAEKTPTIVKETGKTFIEKGSVVPARTIEAGISGAERIVNIPGSATRAVKESIPTPKEFGRFVERKAEPITKIIEEKTPDFVKKTVEPIKELVTREPTAQQLMTPSIRAIYKSEKTSPQAKTMLESATKLEYMLKSTPPEQNVPIKFTEVKYGGKIGEVVKRRLETHKEDILGGSTSVQSFVPGFRGGKPPADFDYYAKDLEGSKNYFLAEAKKVYPDATVKKTPSGMYTISAEGHSVMDIHPLSEYTPVGGRITSGVGRGLPFKDIETLGKGVAPKVIEGKKVMAPEEQLTRKFHGTAKYIARKMVEEPSHVLTGRGKDVPDFLDIASSLAKSEAKIHQERAAKIEAEIKRFKEAEATKLYAKSPEAVLVETGYAAAKEFFKPEHKALPLFGGYKTTSVYPDVVVKGKSPLEYYPEGTKKVENMVGGYYPTGKVEKTSGGYYHQKTTTKVESTYYPTTKKEDTTYPPIKTENGGYYPPNIRPNQYPRPWLDTYWNEQFQSEIPIDLPSFGSFDEPRKKKKQLKEKVLYKPRASPIFEGAEKLFEDKSQKPIKERHISKKKNISNKKQFWET